MSFICTNHRQHILSSVETANLYWSQWIEQGMKQLNQQNPSEGISFFGCALDVADWLVDQPHTYQLNQLNEYLEKLSLSSFLLAECFLRVDRPELELHFLLHLHHRLLGSRGVQQNVHWPLSGYIRQSLERLEAYVEKNGEFTGYKECLVDTEYQLEELNLALN
ncbi:MAG: hypothetical protein KUG72_01375 [Pseudomonadales bacterium]|nr:hypothetical protein [Pseudomonadales bacterium]